MENNCKHEYCKTIRSDFDKKYNIISESENKKQEAVEVIVQRNTTNVVTGDTLRKIQNDTLKEAKKYLSKTFGPMGSNTKIIKGNNRETISSAYSKDGLKVLQNIINSGPIEASIIEELIDISRHVEHEVGDGTTSTVILSSLIFENLMKVQEKYNIPPFQLIRRFESIVNEIKDNIEKSGTECTLEDIYNISMVSTNGNIEVSENIKSIYEQYGMDVDLSVGISNTSDSLIKVYDGLTITEGMSDPVFINNKSNNTSEIHDASVYHFVDPIDTMDMISLFESILNHNIYEPLQNNESPIPTVVTCPRLSKDMSTMLKMLANNLYQYDQSNAESSKPPILIITNVVGSDEAIMDDIANLCGCKSIRKYIDPKMLKKDQESGNAPTIDNIFEFGGKAELVVSDSKKTKFINPLHMHVIDEFGNVEEDPIYTAMVNFLETEIANVKSTDSAGTVGTLKKRLSALKANMVEYLVGGVTILERDSIKDLVEDAIKNCKSAAKYGVGYAANYEALRASLEEAQKAYVQDVNEIDADIARCIFCAYYDIAKILYGTVCNNEEIVEYYITLSLINGYPFDISNGELPNNYNYESGKKVKCSIMLDINILDTISKIITIMVTCNQCLLQSPQLNNY